MFVILISRTFLFLFRKRDLMMFTSIHYDRYLIHQDFDDIFGSHSILCGCASLDDCRSLIQTLYIFYLGKPVTFFVTKNKFVKDEDPICDSLSEPFYSDEYFTKEDLFSGVSCLIDYEHRS